MRYLILIVALQLAGRTADEWITVLDAPDRVQGLKIAEVVGKLGLKPGQSVADIGAGSGIFTRAFARPVRPGGKVFAVEVDVTKLDSDIGQFAAIGAAAVETSPRGVEQYQTAIEEAVNAVWKDATKRAQLIGCTPTDAAADSCTRTFIETMGRRGWRRPLEAEEIDELAGVASTAVTELRSGLEGVRWATVAMFISILLRGNREHALR